MNFLHDVIEDTKITFEEIESEFGSKIANIVLECSDDKNLPKAERKRLQIVHAKTISDEAKLVKLADKLANFGDIVINPPKQWDTERKQAYFNWGKEVVDAGLRGVNPMLDSIFDSIYTSFYNTL